MNKRTITIDQLIREEYLKIQKQNYIKNLVTQILQEQNQTNNVVNIIDNSKPISGGRIRNILIPILKEIGFNVDYESSNRNFSPISQKDDR